MIISKQVSSYTFNQDLSLKMALSHLEASARQILFLVDSAGRLTGVVTDGDIRRWLLSTKAIDLSLPVSVAAQEQYVSAKKGSSPSEIKRLFSMGKEKIPLVDDRGILVGVVTSGGTDFVIGDKKIGNEHPVYIIAEVGNNHQGSLDHAKRLIEMAATAGVDSVKFQMRSMETLYGASTKRNVDSMDLGAQYTSDLLSKFQLSDEQLFEAFDFCKAHGVEPMCTPWDLKSLEKLEKYGLAALKIASADFTNHELLSAAAETNIPLICSTGMCEEDEIVNSVALLRNLGAQCVLLHCNSTYPTPFKDIHLNYLQRLKRFGFDVGYSGHERGAFIPLAAVALGASVVEKHITFDKTQEGNDHKVSLLPDELANMVEQIRSLEVSMGNKQSRLISQGELINREVLAKSLFARVDITKGSKITRDVIGVKSPGQGLQPNKLDLLVGRVANRTVQSGDFFYPSDLDNLSDKQINYSFRRPFGVPVRYHDFESLTKDVNLDFVEFHLSYQDLLLQPGNFLKNQPRLSFAVHAPELFANDHILDLCSFDESYRQTSIACLQEVINHCGLISEFFPNQSSMPILVVNAGGWDTDGFLSVEAKKKAYLKLKDSLSTIDTSNVRLAIQTMPPFPWHFGGQSYHNLFVDPKEIADFCNDTGYKICLDLSHSMMACNYYGWDMNAFIETIKDHIIYLHIVDALGSDGEGIQIGEGDVNFSDVSRVLNQFCPEAPFIPEVWQGHKDSGAGFWSALKYLESYF